MTFDGPRVEIKDRAVHNVVVVPFAGVPVPREVGKPLELNRTFVAPLGATLTLKSVTLLAQANSSSDAAPELKARQGLKLVVAVKQPPQQPDREDRAYPTDSDVDYKNSVVRARDEQGEDWARLWDQLEKPAYKDALEGDYAFIFAVPEAGQTKLLDVEIGLRQKITFYLPKAEPREFFFNLDLKEAQVEATKVAARIEAAR